VLVCPSPKSHRYVYGDFPPDALALEFTVNGASPPEPHVSEASRVSGGLTVRDVGLQSENPAKSLAQTVNEVVPATLGIPLRTPSRSRMRPIGGKPVPESSRKVYGCCPPVGVF